jgi:hypothetical protein
MGISMRQVAFSAAEAFISPPVVVGISGMTGIFG